MIARLNVTLPFILTIPRRWSPKPHEYEINGYLIKFLPPTKSELLKKDIRHEVCQINKISTMKADVLHIEFHKETFKRNKEAFHNNRGIESEPSYSLINGTINSFLTRLRYVTQCSNIRLIDFPNMNWDLKYLNNDGNTLDKKEGLVRTIINQYDPHYPIIFLDKNKWNETQTLSPDYIPPQWNTLLLDAKKLLPEVGPAIVLAFTALEVFINQILNQLAQRNDIPKEIWEWINNRDWLKNPSVEEQYDRLLKILTGKSLKEEKDIWNAFKGLQNARNSFVHCGIIKIKKSKIPKNESAKLVNKASEVIDYVEKLIPPELKRVTFERTKVLQAATGIMSIQE